LKGIFYDGERHHRMASSENDLNAALKNIRHDYRLAIQQVYASWTVL